MTIYSTLTRPGRRIYEALFQTGLFNRRRQRRLADFGLSDRTQAPVANLDCRLTPTCSTPMCTRASLNYDQFFGTLNRPDSHGTKDSDRLVTLMALDLRQYPGFQAYMRDIRKKSYFSRRANKATKLGYRIEQFQFQNYTPDMRAIRQSLKLRSLGLPVDKFVLTPAALRCDPRIKTTIEQPACGHHWEQWFGVFVAQPGHTQGALAVDQRLVAYARIRRIGNTVKYAEFIGHGDNLGDGIMILLHLHLVEWLMNPDSPHTAGVEFITYNTVERGNDGIFFWKRKGLFAPHIINMVEATLPDDFDAQAYLRLNPDVARAGDDPALHYTRHGHLEGRVYRDANASTGGSGVGIK